VYTEVLHDLTTVLEKSVAKGERAKTTISAPPCNEEFRDQRRRKWKPSDDADKRTKKPATSATGVKDPRSQSKNEVPTRNFFVILRLTEMEAAHRDDIDDFIESQQHQAPSSQEGRPLIIVLTFEVKLIHLQRQLKVLLKGSFEFRNTRNGTRVVTKEMEEFLTNRSHFENYNLQNFTFYSKTQKPIKTVIRHLPSTLHAEDISDRLVGLGFAVIGVK
jgi:hypothetical protein